MPSRRTKASYIQENNELVMLTKQLFHAVHFYKRQLEDEVTRKDRLVIMLEACKGKEVANA